MKSTITGDISGYFQMFWNERWYEQTLKWHFTLFVYFYKNNNKQILVIQKQKYVLEAFKINIVLTEERNCETGDTNPAWRYHCRRYVPGGSTSRVPNHESTRLCFMNGLLKSREGLYPEQFLEALKDFHRQTNVYTVRNRDNERIFTMYITLKITL